LPRTPQPKGECETCFNKATTYIVLDLESEVKFSRKQVTTPHREVLSPTHVQWKWAACASCKAAWDAAA
jgi:hypothetical protein